MLSKNNKINGKQRLNSKYVVKAIKNKTTIPAGNFVVKTGTRTRKTLVVIYIDL